MLSTFMMWFGVAGLFYYGIMGLTLSAALGKAACADELRWRAVFMSIMALLGAYMIFSLHSYVAAHYESPKIPKSYGSREGVEYGEEASQWQSIATRYFLGLAILCFVFGYYFEAKMLTPMLECYNSLPHNDNDVVSSFLSVMGNFRYMGLIALLAMLAAFLYSLLQSSKYGNHQYIVEASAKRELREEQGRLELERARSGDDNYNYAAQQQRQEPQLYRRSYGSQSQEEGSEFIRLMEDQN